MNKKMYVDVTEVCEDWGVSRAQGYKILSFLLCLSQCTDRCQQSSGLQDH